MANLQKFHYPTARRDETVVDDYHGKKVSLILTNYIYWPSCHEWIVCGKIVDSYRWLEDPDSTETAAYVEELNSVSRPYIDSCSVKENIRAR